MKLTKTLMATTALTLAAGVANADGHMANEMTIVSWGGAYSSSQQNAYHNPYSEKTGVKIINDESSAEAVAKLRKKGFKAARLEDGFPEWKLAGLPVEMTH